MKSKARQLAGKQKIASVLAWKGDFNLESQALKLEGEQGSLKLNKKGALYLKIHPIRQARLLSLDPVPKAVATPEGAQQALATPKYTGNLKLTKKGALYLKIQPIRQTRILPLESAKNAVATSEAASPIAEKAKESKRKAGKQINKEESIS